MKSYLSDRIEYYKYIFDKFNIVVWWLNYFWKKFFLYFLMKKKMDNRYEILKFDENILFVIYFIGMFYII